MQTLKAGEHKLVVTRGVNDHIAEDTKFAKFVYKSLIRFNRGDWGDVSEDDKKANDAELESLNSGGWYGRILANYKRVDNGHRTNENLKWAEQAIWITRNTAEKNGTQAITVMFPSEY